MSSGIPIWKTPTILLTKTIGSCLLICCILPLQQTFASSEEQGSIWTEGAPLLYPRTEIATEQINGKIYVIGGTDNSGTITDTTQIYNPENDSWDVGASLRVALDHAGLTSFDGKLYVVGGFVSTPEGRHPISSLLIYDPVSDSWDEGSPMPSARAGLTADFVDGLLYAIGGSLGDNEGQLPLNEAYDPETDSWTEMAPMLTARHHHVSSVVDGKIYIMGGRETDVPSNLDTNEMYDPKQDTWVTLESMPTKRSGLAAAALNGSIYVLGGEKTEGSYAVNEKYDLRLNEWTEEKPMPTSRLGHDAVSIGDRIYSIGGKESQPAETVTGVNEIFHLLKNGTG